MMPFDLYTQVLIWGFFIALCFGAIANKANYCTMGAVSDWINFGDLDRLRAWTLSIAVAIIGIGVLEYLGLVDMTLTTSNDTSNPPYRVANFVWLRHLLGGLMFGVGMTLASGCGNKTLVRIGEGNMKSLVVLVIMGLSASMMLFTSIDYWVFLEWMQPLGVDFNDYGIGSQDIGSVVAGLIGAENPTLILLLCALAIGSAQLVWVGMSSSFRKNGELVVAGLVVGGLVIAAWYLTAGATGQELLEELEFMDERPYAAGAQSLSFIAPSGHLTQYIYQGFAPGFLTFGVVTICGIIVGSLVYTLVFRKVRIEWFASRSDFLLHVLGAVLMGVGGIFAMGCTIGQGVSGVATLALGSFVTVFSIIAGSAATMKYQYYLMMREDD